MIGLTLSSDGLPLRIRVALSSVNAILFFPFIVFALLLQLPPFRKSEPGSHDGHSAPSPLRRMPSLLSRQEFSIFFPRRLLPTGDVWSVAQTSGHRQVLITLLHVRVCPVAVGCRLNERYQELYQRTKERLLAMPKGKQFDFSEAQIFGR